jgi:hypothetical protein
MLPTQFRLIWPNGFRGEEYKKSANQKQVLPMTAMFVYGSKRNEESVFPLTRVIVLSPIFGRYLLLPVLNLQNEQKRRIQNVRRI